MIFFINSLLTGGAERVASIIERRFDNISFFLIFNEINFDLNLSKTRINYLFSGKNKSKISVLFSSFFIVPKLFILSRADKDTTSISFLTISNYLNIFFGILSNRRAIIFVRTTLSKEYENRSLRSKLHLFLIKNLFPLSNRIVANSLGVKEDLLSIVNHASEIEVIHNPVSLGVSCKLDDKKRVNKEFTFVTCSRLLKSKNIDLILETFKKLKEDSKLVIIGDGPEKTDLMNLTKDLGLQPNVIFTGQIKEPKEILKVCDCFVFASSYEGFPNVLLEAISCGLPVITTDCLSGPREILGYNQPYFRKINKLKKCDIGYLCPEKDGKSMLQAMEKMLESDRYNNEFHLNILESASMYSEDRFIEKLNELVLCAE